VTGGGANLSVTSNVIERRTLCLRNWAGQCYMCGSTTSRSKLQTRLNSCGVPYVAGVASRLGHLTCEILGDIHDSVGR
jgi:hypothetical protein